VANYVIGDVQGCFAELSGLLDVINFDESEDKLWFVGDLVNRGPDSVNTLKFVYKIKKNCQIVLGNHDIHFLAVAEGLRKPSKDDTLRELLLDEELNLLKEWLRKQPLLYLEKVDCEQGLTTFLMSHAGIPPHWSLEQALKASKEIKNTLSCDKLYEEYLNSIWGNLPNKPEESLNRLDRLRLNTNYLTRMRFCKANGELDLEMHEKFKFKKKEIPSSFRPWFLHSLRVLEEKIHIVFGHWADIAGKTGVSNVTSVDTGCVWGYKLSAFRLEDKRLFSFNHIN